MKRHLILLFLTAASLSGCVVAPLYDEPYAVYAPAPVYTQPYTVVPGYAPPPVVYGPPIYVPPPVRFSFGLNYWSGDGGRHRWHDRGFGPQRRWPPGHHRFNGRPGGWHR